MAAKANPIPQLLAPRGREESSDSCEHRDRTGSWSVCLSVCSYACACTPLQSVCPGLQQFPSAPCSPGTPSHSETEA